MPNDNIIICQFSKIHVEQIMELQKSCFQSIHEENIFVYDNFIKVFPDGAWGVFIEDKLVGHIFFHPYKNKTEKPLNSELKLTGAEDCMYLHEIAVLKEFRSQGISSILLNKYDEVTKQFNMVNQSLVSVENSFEFWQKKGFSIICKANENNYLDGFLMSKQL